MLLCVSLCYFAAVNIVLAETDVTGRVIDESGAPLRATVAPLGGPPSGIVISGEDGYFEVPLGATSLLVWSDDPSTQGFDYLPAVVRVGGVPLTVTLKAAASVAFTGSIQFVDTQNLPTGVTLTVTDSGGSPMNQTGYLLSFRVSSGSSEPVGPSLAPYTMIVPATARFSVRMSVNVLVGSKMETRILNTGELGPIEKGALVRADLGLYSIPYGIRAVKALDSGLGPLMSEMEGRGFYLVRERGAVAHGEAELTSAGALLAEGRLTESFDLLKTSYIDLTSVKQDLAGLQGDASTSVYVLIGFLALASVVVGFVAADRLVTQAPASTAAYAASVMVLYLFYPGSRALPAESFELTAVLLFAASLAAGILLPRLLEMMGGGDRVGLLDVLVPVMSIAKRNLRRRRLRLALTLASLTVMVMGFVSLTSFAEGYGLVSSRVSSAQSGTPRVLIRSGSWSDEEMAFLPAGGVELAWVKAQEGVAYVAPKMETIPAYTSPMSVSGGKLMSVVGVDAALEARATDLEAALTKGSLPGPDGVALSERLVEELGVKLGDTVKLGSTSLVLRGVFDDGRLYTLHELDGRPFLPDKWVNMSPKSETPVYALEECEAAEVALVDAQTATLIPLAGLSRITVGLEDVDPIAFATRMALERGYQAWASGQGGVQLERVGSYVEAKGLPLVVPWAIVALNVVVTTLSGLYERRREIGILSSVGLNPAEISAVFVSEAAVTAFTAGGLGYLAGLGLYRLMPALGLALDVQQKVSATWCVASVGLSLSAVLVGAFAALRGSLIVTPSLTRRWKVGDPTDSLNGLYRLPIPLRLAEDEAEGFSEYLVGRLRGLEEDPVKKTAMVKEEREGEAIVVSFIYRSSQTTTGNFYTTNRVTVERDGDGGYGVRLESVGEAEWVHEAGGLVRLVAMEWSGRKRARSGS